MLVLYLALQGIMPFEPKFTVHLLPACVPGDACNLRGPRARRRWLLKKRDIAELLPDTAVTVTFWTKLTHAA